MQKILFIDRDGTLIAEPQTDFQVDALHKLVLLPNIIHHLHKLRQQSPYLFVIVTNQDGMGTVAFPAENFWETHNKMIALFESQGITFDAVHIDEHFEHDNSPNRKPNTGMLGAYFSPAYDLQNSYTIGDRLTDILLAKNLGAKGILLRHDYNKNIAVPDELRPFLALEAQNWEEIANFLLLPHRKITLARKTNETDIAISLNLDGTGKAQIHTGLGFFDHLLDQLAKHSGIDMQVQVQGDLHIDEHHTIEDTAIALGEAFGKALGDKKGIQRYGFCLPMDDCLAQVALDFGGRSWLVWEASFKREKIGEMPTEMFEHFFKSFGDGAKANLNIKAEGTNEHHKIEAIFKALAKAIKAAVWRDADKMVLPSTKGVL
jgi:imidazoleglycerol-phosphate dehydratase / histidinol-phosphatase